MDNFDDTTYQAERLMHKPSHSKGGDYFFFQDGEWLNPDEILSEYEDWRDVSFGRKVRGVKKLEKTSEKQATR